MKSLNGFQIYNEKDRTWVDVYSKDNLPTLKDFVGNLDPIVEGWPYLTISNSKVNLDPLEEGHLYLLAYAQSAVATNTKGIKIQPISFKHPFSCTLVKTCDTSDNSVTETLLTFYSGSSKLADIQTIEIKSNSLNISDATGILYYKKFL